MGTGHSALSGHKLFHDHEALTKSFSSKPPIPCRNTTDTHMSCYVCPTAPRVPPARERVELLPKQLYSVLAASSTFLPSEGLNPPLRTSESHGKEPSSRCREGLDVNQKSCTASGGAASNQATNSRTVLETQRPKPALPSPPGRRAGSRAGPRAEPSTGGAGRQAGSTFPSHVVRLLKTRAPETRTAQASRRRSRL